MALGVTALIPTFGDGRGQRIIWRADERSVSATANYEILPWLPPKKDAQRSATAETRSRGSNLRMFNFLLGPFRAKQEGTQ